MAQPEGEPAIPTANAAEEGLIDESFAASLRRTQGEVPDTYGAAGEFSKRRLFFPNQMGDLWKANPIFSMCVFGNSTAMNIMVFTVLPWAILTLVMWPFALGYRSLAGLAWFVFALFMLLSLAFIWLGTRSSVKPTLFWTCLGGKCVLTCVLGMLLGLYINSKYALRYHAYEASPSYTNVVPTEDPGARKDAGSITFSEDSFVDFSRSLGHKDGNLYCVAPVLNSAIAGGAPAPGTTLTTVNYWAVGQNCCNQRGTFWCGSKGKEIGGLVVMDVSPSVQDTVPQYITAVKQAAATYGILAPDDVILVEWGVDKKARAMDLRHQATQFYGRAVCIYILVILAIYALGMAMVDSRNKAHAKR